MAGPVTIPYSLLANPDQSVPALIQQAFSSEPGALGLLIVSDLPERLEFGRLRNEVLLLSNKFASLPEHTRDRYADPSKFWAAWSGDPARGARRTVWVWAERGFRSRRYKVELRMESWKGNYER